MKSTTSQSAKFMGLKPALLIAAVLAFGSAGTLRADPSAKVVPPNSSKYGNDYAGWSAAWWQWNLALPVAGHPGVDSPDFDVTAGQSGEVWFLGAPFGTVERTCTIPAGKALFFPMFNAECSSLEAEDSGFHGDTAKEQRTCAKYWANHIVNPYCEIDGASVAKPETYRVTSPQFTFTAPTPWIFGETGGTGTSVGDGYYILLAPLSPGGHTLSFGGVMHFTLAEDGFDADFPIDMTYHLTVQ
jgi:hypothetical protein